MQANSKLFAKMNFIDKKVLYIQKKCCTFALEIN